MKKYNKRWIIICALVGLLVVMLVGCTKREKEESGIQEIHILAAASMTDAFAEVKVAFEKEYPEIVLTFSFDSSGTLKTQIEEGAPADIFISAATAQMKELDQAGLMKSESIIELLENKIVLIKPQDSKLDLKNFQDVATDKVKMIAIGGEGVPVGQYTKTIYTNLGMWEAINRKANLGTNVRQVLDWVTTGNVDCGIVYETDAKIESKVQIVCEAPEGSCESVIYPAGIIKETKFQKEAEIFMTFLGTKEAKEILETYGFVVL